MAIPTYNVIYQKYDLNKEEYEDKVIKRIKPIENLSLFLAHSYEDGFYNTSNNELLSYYIEMTDALVDILVTKLCGETIVAVYVYLQAKFGFFFDERSEKLLESIIDQYLISNQSEKDYNNYCRSLHLFFSVFLKHIQSVLTAYINVSNRAIPNSHKGKIQLEFQDFMQINAVINSLSIKNTADGKYKMYEVNNFQELVFLNLFKCVEFDCEFKQDVKTGLLSTSGGKRNNKNFKIDSLDDEEYGISTRGNLIATLEKEVIEYLRNKCDQTKTEEYYINLRMQALMNRITDIHNIYYRAIALFVCRYDLIQEQTILNELEKFVDDVCIGEQTSYQFLEKYEGIFCEEEAYIKKYSLQKSLEEIKNVVRSYRKFDNTTIKELMNNPFFIYELENILCKFQEDNIDNYNLETNKELTFVEYLDLLNYNCLDYSDNRKRFGILSILSGEKNIEIYMNK